jgi:arylsulfatase A-like enzyme
VKENDTMKKILSLIVLLAACTGSAEKRPNILFIVCDDLNTHVTPSGYDAVKTPVLSTLAQEGMVFNRAFCQYPVCGPSRASFLHGLYPESTGVLDNKADIRKSRPNTVSMPQYFKQNGYWTASVGKVFHSPSHEHGDNAWDIFQRFENDELPVVAKARKEFEAKHGSVEESKNVRKWKQFKKQVAAKLDAQTPPGHGPSGLTDEQHKDGKNARQVVQWLKDKSYGDKPFFITLGIQKPHVPFLAPDKYFDMYPRGEITFHRDPSNLWETLPSRAISRRYKAFGFELGKENVPRRRKYMQAYHACVTFIDTQIGLVVSQLKEQGLWDNTVIIFTSDHGYHLGDHFLWGKVTLFDIGARVPFIVCVPGMTRAGSRSDAMVELVDIFPTLTELANLKAPVHLQGKSLVPVLKDPDHADVKNYAYSVVSRGEKLGYAIRNQKWRYGKWPDGEELYNLTNDPHERNNLAKNIEFNKQLMIMRRALKETQSIAKANKVKP